eukprot:4836177-Alexandrium_andersonii.AAC.1
MSASLVGSEMCIRDSFSSVTTALQWPVGSMGVGSATSLARRTARPAWCPHGSSSRPRVQERRAR